MRAVEAYADLRRFGRTIFTTEDAALRMRTTVSAATRTLGRLASDGLVLGLRRGLWSLDLDVDPLVVPEALTGPFPAYVSFQSALSAHGMISQIPQVVYVASLGRPRHVATAVGTYSIHRLAPEFFGGYREDEVTHVKLATPEKALLDVFYLAASKSRLFARLPEIELPRRFDVKACRRWIRRIPAEYRRTMVEERLKTILAEQ